MNWINRLGCLGAMLFCMTSATNAALVSMDDAAYGVGSITLDTATDLQWLDVPLSLNRSYLDVATQFGPAGDFPGFRHATSAEAVQLFTNAGIPDIDTNSASVANLVPATALTALTGVTGTQSGNPQTFGFLSDDAGGGTRFNANLDYVSSNGNDAYNVNTSLLARGQSFEFSTVGHWLVRAVPEPSPVGLLCAGVCWLLFRVRSRS